MVGDLPQRPSFGTFTSSVKLKIRVPLLSRQSSPRLPCRLLGVLSINVSGTTPHLRQAACRIHTRIWGRSARGPAVLKTHAEWMRDGDEASMSTAPILYAFP